MSAPKPPKPKPGCLFRLTRALVIFVVLVLILAYLYIPLPFWGIPFNGSRHANPPLTPMWALEPWLWEDDVNTAEEVLRLVAGYEQYDIPVRTVLIDSPWSMRYNDFALDEERYDASFYTDLQDRGYRVVLWMTCMVNDENKDTRYTDGPEAQSFFDDAKANGYLAAGGNAFGWWKGHGGFVDYSNPDAMTWWRGLQEEVFALGIDGWKLDGTATFFRTQLGPVPIPYAGSHGGLMTTRGYMDHYYRDEYQHGLTKNPEFITLVRSYDRGFHPEGFSPIDAAPVAWVGDQDHTWSLEDEGIEEALEDVMRSIDRGYPVVGSDIGGYGGAEIPANLYIRWAQWSTFCGWFSNGGHGNRALWERTPEELEIIRKFTWLRQELVPYIYTHVRMHHEGGEPLMRTAPGKYQYYFGPDFLVAPIYEDSLERIVDIPEGRWVYFFDPSETIEGPTTITREFPLDEFPVFVREGAVIPLNVTSDYTGIGAGPSGAGITWIVYPDPSGWGRESLTLENGERPFLDWIWDLNQIKLSKKTETVDRVIIYLNAKPAAVRAGSEEVPFEYELSSKRLSFALVDGNEVAITYDVKDVPKPSGP